jgi:hypothetical protein
LSKNLEVVKQMAKGDDVNDAADKERGLRVQKREINFRPFS